MPQLRSLWGIGKAWYGPGGALMTNAPVPGCSMTKLDDDMAKFYGGPYMIAESMSKRTARTIARALRLEFIEDHSYES